MISKYAPSREYEKMQLKPYPTGISIVYGTPALCTWTHSPGEYQEDSILLKESNICIHCVFKKASGVPRLGQCHKQWRVSLVSFTLSKSGKCLSSSSLTLGWPLSLLRAPNVIVSMVIQCVLHGICAYGIILCVSSSALMENIQLATYNQCHNIIIVNQVRQ